MADERHRRKGRNNAKEGTFESAVLLLHESIRAEEFDSAVSIFEQAERLRKVPLTDYQGVLERLCRSVAGSEYEDKVRTVFTASLAKTMALNDCEISLRPQNQNLFDFVFETCSEKEDTLRRAYKLGDRLAELAYVNDLFAGGTASVIPPHITSKGILTDCVLAKIVHSGVTTGFERITATRTSPRPSSDLEEYGVISFESALLLPVVVRIAEENGRVRDSYFEWDGAWTDSLFEVPDEYRFEGITEYFQEEEGANALRTVWGSNSVLERIVAERKYGAIGEYYLQNTAPSDEFSTNCTNAVLVGAMKDYYGSEFSFTIELASNKYVPLGVFERHKIEPQFSGHLWKKSFCRPVYEEIILKSDRTDEEIEMVIQDDLLMINHHNTPADSIPFQEFVVNYLKKKGFDFKPRHEKQREPAVQKESYCQSAPVGTDTKTSRSMLSETYSCRVPKSERPLVINIFFDACEAYGNE